MDDTIAPAVKLDSHNIPISIPTDKSEHPDWTQMMQSYDHEYAYQVASVKNRMQQLVAQLLHGCGHTDCKLQYCATGLRNTTCIPLRDYTPRSARILALELLKRPDCDDYICKYYQLNGPSRHQAPEEGPRDPSSFIQRIADTSCVVQLAKGEFPADTGEESPIFHKVAAITRVLSAQCEHPFLSSGSSNPLFVSNEKIAESIAVALQLFYDLLPEESNPATWQSLAQHVNNGRTLPSTTLDSKVDQSALVELLDIFAFEPYVHLCAQICKVIALRTQVEDVTAKFRQTGIENTSQGTILALISERVTLVARSQTASKQDSWIPWPYPLWFKKAFLKYWDGTPVVKRGTIACGALELLEMQQKLWDRSNPQKTSDANLLPYVYKRVQAVELMRSWMKHDPPATTRSRHLLSFPFLYSDGQTLMNFRMLNHLRMREAFTSSHVNEELFDRYIASSDRASLEWDNRAPETQHLRDFYLLLTVRRDHILEDAFNQLWQRRKCELLRPLRVRLGEMEGTEVGQDLGGVQIEFFNLVCKALFSEDAGMFTTDPITGLSYFRPGSLQPLYMFELFGLLVALAAYNGITVPVSFPLALYKHLLDLPCTDLRDIQDGWPDIARSLQNIKDGAYEGLDYVFPLEANGLRMSVNHSAFRRVREQCDEHKAGKRAALDLFVDEMSRIDDPASAASASRYQPSDHQWPGWNIHSPHAGSDPEASSSTSSPTTITTSSRHPPDPPNNEETNTTLTQTNLPSYLTSYTLWLTTLSTHPQLQSFKKGFHALLPHHDLSLFTPSSLRSALEGTSTLDLAALRASTEYKNYTPDEPYITSFWSIISSWTPEKQKALLKFVTAAERIPISGAGALTFRVQFVAGGGGGGGGGEHRVVRVEDHGGGEHHSGDEHRSGGQNQDASGVGNGRVEFLPTSSTCFGTLYLPRYKDEETLERKLGVALEFGGVGFGTA